MSFKNQYKMVGLSADWVNRCWEVMNTTDGRKKVVIFQEDDNKYHLLIVEYHGEDYDIQTYEVFSTYDENEMTTHINTNEYFYNVDKWLHKLPTQMMEPLTDIEWIK